MARGNQPSLAFGRLIAILVPPSEDAIALGVVVDIDLSKFFDRVHHQRLLSRLGPKVADSRVLKLIGRMLKAKVVLPDGTRVCTDEGFALFATPMIATSSCGASGPVSG